MGWRALARCRGADPSLFFSGNAVDVAKARRCCAECPVQQPCREEARSNNEYGIWGGEMDNERPAVRVTVR